MFNFLPLSAIDSLFADNVTIIEKENFRFQDGIGTMERSM